MTTVAIDRRAATLATARWLESLGLPQRASDVVAGHVVDAESVGRESHGLRLLPALARGITRSTELPADVTVAERESGTLVVDASGLPGIYALHRATDEVMNGHVDGRSVVATGVVGFRWTTGCLGLFAHRLAGAGLTSLVLVTSPPIMAPPGGAHPLLGTNAISFGAPTGDGTPIVGDFASSERSYGDIALARDRNESVPLGVLLDSAGSPTTNPSDVVDGTLVPSGGHRGWSQALLVELLAGALVGGKVGRGHGGESALVLSFALDAFAATDAAGAARELVEQIRSTSTAPDGRPAHVPGARYERLGAPGATLDVPTESLRRIEAMGGPALM